MDPFLQLDAGEVVYDDLGEPVDLETQIQHHIAESTQAEALFSEQLYRPVGENEAEYGTGHSTAESDELERQRYLQCVLSIEKGIQATGNEMQRQIDTMKRILELKDPMEQLSEYLALKQAARRKEDVGIVEDLVHWAKRMTNEQDSEVATLGTFFLCDRQRHRARGMAAMLPVVAAVMETISIGDI
ncbi:hypothetical protein PHMEG_00011241 [Phytophthora megakarya]|uniref:Uncharacterized protein n=1 Tax=Phytophthora megakarya TaxID=4795 RepID=A0A225WC15_9STRA|nr:hypothetical protein PHMEG_00011241 [Phytophthora megakarya]